MKSPWRRWKLVCIVAGLVLWAYVGAYVLMMDYRLRAWKSGGGPLAAASVYRLAPAERIPGDFSIYQPTTSWPNVVFWPIDRVVRRLRAGIPPANAPFAPSELEDGSW
jgi:hypothetical protein